MDPNQNDGSTPVDPNAGSSVPTPEPEPVAPVEPTTVPTPEPTDQPVTTPEPESVAPVEPTTEPTPAPEVPGQGGGMDGDSGMGGGPSPV